MWIINSTHLLALFVLLAVEPSASTPIGRNGNDQVAAQRRLHPTLVNAPSLKLQFKLKRRSMNIYNQCEFTVLATPVVSSDNTSVLYDSIATFVENATTTHTFTLVDGMEFFSTSTGGQPGTAECFSPSPLPPFNEIVQALNHATAISSAAVGSQAITCSSGSLLQITLSDDPFVVCASGLAGFDIYGSDLDIQVRYQDKRTPITSNADGLICDQVVSATPVTPTTLALLTGQPIPESTHQKSGNAAKLPSSSCLCKSKRRPCIFFHGFGSKKEDTTLQTRSDYFGDLSQYAPCCLSIKYAVLNTEDHAWTEEALQQKVCNFAISVSSTSSVLSKTIADTIIVTHSMGGLMMAGALANGHCKFASSTTWVSVSAPMTGSMASNYFQEVCSGDNTFLKEEITQIGEKCPASNGILSLAYEDEPKYTSSNLNPAYAAAQTAYRANVHAAMCSDDFSGLFSTREAIFQLAGYAIPHKSLQNDGIVEYRSCAGGLPTSKFGNSYHAQFYVTGLNHADTAFRYGEALINKSKKPVKWFECLL